MKERCFFMTSAEQKRIWEKEKEQQRRDKQAQGRVVKHRKVSLKMGKSKPKATKPKPTTQTSPSLPPDEILRQQLGI